MKAETLKRRWLEQDEAEIDAAIGALLEHAHGRTFLWWLLEIGGVGRQPFAGNALTTSFNCGELNVGNKILDRIITANPQGYVNLMKEQADVRNTRSAELAGTDDAARNYAPEPDFGDDSAD